jgi:hypothetical protein
MADIALRALPPYGSVIAWRIDFKCMVHGALISDARRIYFKSSV